jgi:hypothetical protein
MSVWMSIGGAVCVAITAVGLVASWRIWRKGGASRGIRAAAWSLIPLAAYLVGAVGLLGRIVSAVVRFAGAFVFSPKSWAGVAVLGVVVVLFLASGGLPLLNWRKARERRKQAKAKAKAKAGGEDSRQAVAVGSRSASAGTAPVSTAPAPRTTVPARTAAAPSASDDDDMSDVQEILRRRGIK